MHSQRTDMHSQRTVDRTPTAHWDSPLAMVPPAVASRSSRRATARRASQRRATARQHKIRVEAGVIEYLNDHPGSTTGAIAKGLNADRGTIAAALSHVVGAGDVGRRRR